MILNNTYAWVPKIFKLLPKNENKLPRAFLISNLMSFLALHDSTYSETSDVKYIGDNRTYML